VIYSGKQLLLAVDPPAVIFRGLVGYLPRSNDAQDPAFKEAQEWSRCRVSGFTNPACPLRMQKQAREQACLRTRSGLIDRVNGIVGTVPCIHAAVMSGMLLDRNAMAAEAGIMRPQRLRPAVQGGDRTCSPGGTDDHVAPASALSYPSS